MTILDANLLLYAYNADAPQHRAAAGWLAKLVESGELIGLLWVTVWAFIRISTNSRIWANPRPDKEVFAIVAEWLAQPGVVPLQPGPLHGQILEKTRLRARRHRFAANGRCACRTRDGTRGIAGVN